VSVELVFSPSSVGEFPCELVVESADAGKYQVAMYGHSIAPQPQGPHSIKVGGSAKIEFQNVFDEQKQFNFVCDNPAFTCKAGESIAAKKKTTIDVAFKPVAEGGATAHPLSAFPCLFPPPLATRWHLLHCGAASTCH
jgi:hydrocephalus-inducing protein